MLSFFRNMFKSKIGLAIVLGFVGLIAFAFASADISGTTTFGGVAGGDRVAVVGDAKIGTADLAREVNAGLERARQDDPSLTMQAYVARGGLTDALDTLIDRNAFREYARINGLRAGTNLVNSEIRKIPAFRGADGNFSEETYRLVLAQNQLTDQQVRDDITTSLIAQQLLAPTGTGTAMPQALAVRYAQLFKERRQGSIVTLPAESFAPKAPPSDAQLQAFYAANRSQFIRPERRVIRYASFDASSLGAAAEPTEAEIAASYRENAPRYAASETRALTQLIVPTQAAAASIRAKVASGQSLENAATAAGLRVSPIEGLSRDKARSQFSAQVADAYFSAARGALTAPARSPLGWHIARIDTVTTTPARTLAQVRGEIADALRAQKRASALTERALRVEELIEDGATLAEIASEFKLTVAATRPVLANGQVYGTAERAPELVLPAVQSAFQMDEGEPSVTPLANGATYLIYDVSAISPAAAAPLAEIRDDVAAAWRRSEGARGARAAADRVLAQLAKGQSLQQALATVSVAGTSVQTVNLTREDLARMREQRVPPPLALMFSMAQGTAKKLELPGRLGWSIVDLDAIQVDPIAPGDPLIAQASQQLGPLAGQEYAEQLRIAIRDAVGVERNTAAIEAVRRQLLGRN